MGLSTQIDAAVSYRASGSPNLGDLTSNYAGFPNIVLDNGVAANQADTVYSETRTLAASAFNDLDLAGTLVNPLGAAAVFVKVKAIAIKARATNTNNVVLGAAAANGFIGPFGAATHTIAIPPGGEVVLVAPAAGWTVTPSTGDLLRTTNSGAGTSVVYDIVVIGTSV